MSHPTQKSYYNLNQYSESNSEADSESDTCDTESQDSFYFKSDCLENNCDSMGHFFHLQLLNDDYYNQSSLDDASEKTKIAQNLSSSTKIQR